MVDIVAGRVTRVLDTLETFKSQWTPAIARQIELVRRVYNELLIDDDPEAELSVTAEVVLAQAMEKLGDMLQEVHELGNEPFFFFFFYLIGNL